MSEEHVRVLRDIFCIFNAFWICFSPISKSSSVGSWQLNNVHPAAPQKVMTNLLHVSLFKAEELRISGMWTWKALLCYWAQKLGSRSQRAWSVKHPLPIWLLGLSITAWPKGTHELELHITSVMVPFCEKKTRQPVTVSKQSRMYFPFRLTRTKDLKGLDIFAFYQ